MEAIQQQSFPITEARVISSAAPPQQKSSPKTSYVLALATFIGLVISFGASFLRESVDQVFRTTRQIETVLHTNCLAILPLIGRPSKSNQRVPNLFGLAGAKDPVKNESSRAVVDFAPAAARSEQSAGRAGSQPNLNRTAQTKGAAPSSSVAASGRLVSRKPKLMRQAIDEPLAAFAEAFRSIKVAVDINGSRKASKVVGFTSTLPKEGKSTTSTNFAQLSADAGNQVILLDGDLRNPALTRSLAPNAKKGLLEVLSNEVELNQALFIDEDTGLHFLPAVIQSRVFHTNEILASEEFKELIEKLRKSYDYIVVDFPPMAPVVDVRATTEIIDSYIYVIEWGKTRISLVQHQLLSFPELHDRLLGVVLNKANVNVLARYESYYGRYYHKNYYSGQYPHSA
jgi:succinoglycan biosynthesis transport protein ExoP